MISVLVQRSSDDDPGSTAPAVKASPAVAKALGALSPEQKADAVVAAGVDPASAVTTVTKAQLGGVVIGPDDWSAGGAGLVRRVREAGASGGRVPPFVIGLQEGGVYRAYPDLPPAESQLDIGLSG